MKDQEIVEQLPWYGTCELVKEYSYARVAVFLDGFPVTEGHMLFVPLNPDSGIEYAINRAYQIGVKKVQEREWDGFNVGLNYNEAAGQTVNWPHVHLIPRMKGDCKNPSGGVRSVIPGKQSWKKLERKQKNDGV